jgi:hypothetical protein
MDNWKELTLGDVARGFTRYRPFILAVVAVLMVTLALPDDKRPTDTSEFAGSGRQLDVAGQRQTRGDAELSTTPTSVDQFGNVVTFDDAGNVVGGSETTETTGVEAVNPASFGPDCDPSTGRVRIPISTAPPCMPTFSGSNGGATASGVTAKEIKVVYYQPQADPAVTAALTAAGANNSEPEQEATVRDYVDLFNKHFQMYGRHVVIEVKHGSGKTDDDAAARADAVDIATRAKPFAVFGSPTSNAFPAELAARKILCVCTTSQPQELYEQYKPYVGYTPLMASTQGYIQRAEYVGKRLAGRNATHAGDAVMQTRKRVFGLLYYETPDNAYRSGAQFFQKELQSKYGVQLAVVQSTPSDYAAVQEQSRSVIAKLKDAKVTSVVLSEDPISPALLTKEATRQNYFPEWILTGSALTDTSLFARTYDTAQWRHAFGISFLTARVPEEQTDAYKVHMWHFGRPPTAANQYGTIFPTPLTFALGVTMAGPDLTVGSWQKGLFSYPVTNKGAIASPQISFGNHGVWPMTDYTAFDDVTEIFWDPTVVGPDELDNQGAGMYRYVAGGKRYLPGQHPTTDPKVFVNDGTVTIYDKSPDKPVPNYEHKHYYAGQ